MMQETHLIKSRQTNKLGLIIVTKELFPEEKLKTAYSIQEGVFCRLEDSSLSIREVKLIEERLREWIASKPLIRLQRYEDGYYYYQVGDDIVNMIYPCETDSSKMAPFCIIPYDEGFIVDFGDIGRDFETPLIPPDKLASTYEKTQKWA